MATVLPTRFHPGWLGKLELEIAAHRIKSFAVILASGLLGGSFGLIIFSAILQSGDVRSLVMLFPHAVASTFVFTLLLAGIFSLHRRDP